MMKWLDYANQGAIRNQPINPQLASALGFLPEMGVTMRVFSGGQDASGPRRTGSKRHDHGNSSDVFFYRDGRKLDWNNPNDVPLFQEIVKRGKAAGVTGWGAGPGYMQPGSMHLGFGKPAVWGKGGKGANAPQWLRAAYNGGPAGGSMQAAYQPPAAPAPFSTPSTMNGNLGQPVTQQPYAPTQTAIAPSQAPSTRPAWLHGLARFGGTPEKRDDFLSGLMHAGQSMAGGGQQQMPMQQSFVVPSAPPGTINPTPQGGDDPRQALIEQLLRQQQA